MAILGEPIWPDIEYEREVVGNLEYDVPVDDNDEIRWMENELTNQPTEGIKGCIISFPVGDGKAFYKVTKLRPLTISPIMFMDRSEVPDYTIRGLNKADVEKKVNFDRKWKKLAGGTG